MQKTYSQINIRFGIYMKRSTSELGLRCSNSKAICNQSNLVPVLKEISCMHNPQMNESNRYQIMIAVLRFKVGIAFICKLQQKLPRVHGFYCIPHMFAFGETYRLVIKEF